MPRRIAQERVPTMPEVAPDHTPDLSPFCSFVPFLFFIRDLSQGPVPFCSFLDRYFPSPSPEKRLLLIVPKLSLLHRTS